MVSRSSEKQSLGARSVSPYNSLMDELRGLIRDVPDFPEPGVMFKDITPLLGDHAALEQSLDGMTAPFLGQSISHVLGIESRGFILAVPVAARLGAGFVPVRKPGKLPFTTISETYQLEYGTDSLEMHADAVGHGDTVLVVDDVIATGGTAAATVELARRLGATVVGLAVLVELTFLGGRSRVDVPVDALVVYDD